MVTHENSDFDTNCWNLELRWSTLNSDATVITLTLKIIQIIILITISHTFLLVPVELLFLQLQQRTNIVNYDSRENHLTMRPQPFPQHLLQPCLGCLQTSLWLCVNPVLGHSAIQWVQASRLGY